MRSVALAAMAALLLAGPVVAQGQKAAGGQAALSGAWTRYPETGAEPDPKLPVPAPVPPPPLKQPYKAEWEKKQKEIADAIAAGKPPYTHYVQCIPDGMPAMMQAMFPFELLQTPGRITIIEEAYNQVRRVRMNEKLPPVADTEPGFFGYSVGHWEGNTLVVETIAVKERARYRDTPHSDQMKVTERFHLAGPDFLHNDVTVTDPAYLEKPWTWTWAYTRRPGYTLYEYVCEENRQYQDESGATRLKVRDK